LLGIPRQKSKGKSAYCQDCASAICDDCERCGNCSADNCLLRDAMGEGLASTFCMTLDKTELAKNTQIDLPEDDSGALYIVRSGVLMINVLFPDGRRSVLDFRYAGELFYGSFKRYRSGVSLQAIDATRLLIIPNDTISDLSAEFPLLGKKLITLAATQIEESCIHNLILNRLTAEERIASFLYNLAVRTGRPMVDRIEFVLPMNRADIADFLGLNSETVSRTLTRLKKNAIIELPRPGEAYVDSLDTLAKLTPIAAAIDDGLPEDLVVNGSTWPGLRKMNGTGAP
jgi:CRP/FNR family transcriptional regulator